MIKSVQLFIAVIVSMSCLHASEDGYEYRLGVASSDTALGYMLVVVRDMPNILPELDMNLFASKNELKELFGDRVFPLNRLWSLAYADTPLIVLHVLDNQLIGLLLDGLRILANDPSVSVFLNKLCVTGLPAALKSMQEYFPTIQVREELQVDDSDDESTFSSDSEPDENNYVAHSSFKKWVSYLKNTDLKAYALVCKFIDDYAAGRCPDIKKLNDFIYEYKQFTKANGLRIYFCNEGDVTHLLDGGSKIGQQSDIDASTGRAESILDKDVVEKRPPKGGAVSRGNRKKSRRV
jgi:putative addiction module killer protein